ncbi:MAG TPA: MraY family glycosyltransferase [Solirubrobacterales bacterium]|nr:MraY family glycosyltransferase [Solirubrobacterales bacterium]
MSAGVEATLAFLLAGILALLLVPLTDRLARRIGAIDYPDDQRSLHAAPTPRLGGLAIFAAVLTAALIWLPWDAETRAILAGAALIVAIGMLDDVHELNAATKLLGQTVAVIVPVSAGVTVDSFTVPFFGQLNPGTVELVGLPGSGSIDLGDVGTTIGIVAMINVINLIDGVDGLAAGVCLISGIALAVIALSLDRTAAGILAALTAGASLGFLRHVVPPASTFMGDTGSNLLGYLLGVVAVQGALKTNAVIALFLPLIILTVPILDTGFVVAKRLKYRRPIYRADTWHFHHRMANIGFSQRRTLAYLYGWTLVMAMLALALRFVPYSDDHGNFDVLWSAVIGLFGLAALAASVYLVYVLEILKLRRFGRVDPQTGEFGVVDPETGEFEAILPGDERPSQ